MFASAVVWACHKDEGTTVACDATGSDHDTLFRRGADLIGPHMLLVDRKPAPHNDHEVRVGIACLDRVLAIDPANWSASWIRGKGLQSLGDHGAAVESFRSAYRMNPAHQDVAREFAEELLETRQFDDAVRVAREVSNRHPDDGGLKANLALALLMDGQVGAAQSSVAEALESDPNDEITKALAKRIVDVGNGSRAQPKSLEELQRDK